MTRDDAAAIARAESLPYVEAAVRRHEHVFEVLTHGQRVAAEYRLRGALARLVVGWTCSAAWRGGVSAYTLRRMTPQDRVALMAGTFAQHIAEEWSDPAHVRPV